MGGSHKANAELTRFNFKLGRQEALDEVPNLKLGSFGVANEVRNLKLRRHYTTKRGVLICLIF